MATSGSVDYNQTRNEIIQDAYNLIGVYGVGRTISSEDQAFAERSLNRMIKHWQSQGIHLWSKEEAYLFIADNTGSYILNNTSGSARATNRTDGVLTQLNGAHAASATALTVDDTTGMTAADIIGIVNDDDVVTWDTIASVDSSTTLTLDTGLDGACADNNNVYTFTSRINKPLRIHSMRRVTGIGSSTVSESAIPMVELSHSEYFDLPNKSMNGVPSHFYYSPDTADGTVYLWPRPDDPATYFEFTYERMLEDFDASTDNPDFPVEWLDTIVHQLAVRLAEAFGKDDKLKTLVPKAADMLRTMLDWDSETTSMFLQADQ